MTPWQPNMADGWRPRLSVVGDRIFITWGNAACWLAELRLVADGFQEVRRQQISGAARAYGGWWIGPGQLTFYQEGPGPLQAQRFVLDATAASWIVTATADDPALVAGNDFMAADGHWASWAGVPQFRTVYDGTVQATGCGYPQLAGNRIAAPDAYPGWPTGIATWKDGKPGPNHPCLIPMTALLLADDGRIVYGGNGDLYAIDPSGLQQRCLATPWRYESPGAFVRGTDGTMWLATLTFDPSVPPDQPARGWVLLRPWADGLMPDVAVVAVPANAIHVSLAALGDQFLVATSGDRGQLLLQTVPVGTALTQLVPLVRPMKPSWVGYFYAAGRYGDYSPAANCTVLALANFGDGSTPPIIPADAPARMRAAAQAASAIFIGPDDLDVFSDPWIWTLVAGIVLGEYATSDAIDAAAATARARVAGRQRSARQIIATITPQQMFTATWRVPKVDALAVEVYFDATASWNDMAVATARRIDAILAAAGGLPVILIPQCHDRDVAAWKTADGVTAREAILVVCFERAADHDQIIGIWPFAYARPGGVRAYPVLETWVAAGVKATSRPSVVIPAQATPAPTVTITAYLPVTGDAPLTVAALIAVTGPVSVAKLRARLLGTAAWTDLAVSATNPQASIIRLTGILSKPGTYEIGATATGPGGSAETGKQRLVIATTPAQPQQPKEPTMDAITVSLKCSDGIHYLRAEDGGGREGDQVQIGAQRVGKKTVPIFRPKGLLSGAGPDDSAWQTFRVRPGKTDGTVGFQADDGGWMSAQADGTIVCNRQKPDDYVPEAWEAFLVRDLGDGRIALKTDHGWWITAENGGGGQVDARDRGHGPSDPGPWETFTPSVSLTVVDPSRFSLQDLAKIRGAMWSVRAPVKLGPHPGQPNNIVALDYLEWYDDGDRQLALDAYLKRGYRHAVSGPPIDPGGYHNQFPAEPGPMTQAIWDRQLDALETLWKAGLIPIFFLHPDGWTFEQTRDTFTPYLQQTRAQRLIRIIVPTGWEPTQYGWSSVTWAAFLKWAGDLLPNALICAHTVSDVDAMVGTDERFDDNDPAKNPKGNAGGWDRVAPYLHVWLIQNGPYRTGPDQDPTLARNFAAQFEADGDGPTLHSIAWHFRGAGGWTHSSKWGDGIPVLLVNGECTAYESYWHDLPEDQARAWGDLAIKSGAGGYLDGGTVDVT